MKTGLVVALASAVIVGGALLALRWTTPSPPDPEVERDWAVVHTWAAAKGPLGRAPLSTALPRKRWTLPEDVAGASDWPEGAVPHVDPAKLPPTYLADVDGLLRWGAAPAFGGRCGDGPPALDLRNLLRVALATAGPEDVARAHAVLNTAMAIRRVGGAVDALIGMSLATDVARWAAARGVPAWPALARAAATPEEFRQIAAREALCAADLLTQAIAAESKADAAVLRHQLTEWKRRTLTQLQPLQLIAEPTWAALRESLPKTTEDAQDSPIAALEVQLEGLLASIERQATEHRAALETIPVAPPPAAAAEVVAPAIEAAPEGRE